MNEYKITRQAVDMEWPAVRGASAREMELHPPSGDEWILHSFEHSDAQVVAVWERLKRPHAMSAVYSDAESEGDAAMHKPVKTIADMPEPGHT